ncbi:hypothetical protein TB1_017907 [Malus domestica]
MIVLFVAVWLSCASSEMGGIIYKWQGKEAAEEPRGGNASVDIWMYAKSYEESKLVCGALHAQAVSYLHMLLIHNSGF